MKRAMVLVLVFFAAALCFAKGQRSSFEVGIGFNSVTETDTVSGIEVKTTVPSFAINLAGIGYFTESVGIGVYAGLLFPQKIKMTGMGQSFTIDRSAYETLLAADILLGPVFMLYRRETFCLPLGVGIHWYSLWSNASGNKSSMGEIGLGANISGEYHFNQNIYGYARFQIAYDFHAWGTSSINGQSESSSGKTSTWGLQPCLGIGFKW